MKETQLILAALTLLAASVTVMSKSRGPLLAFVLPRKTFDIHDVEVEPAVVGWRPIHGPRVPGSHMFAMMSHGSITNMQPTRAPLRPMTADQQRFRGQQPDSRVPVNTHRNVPQPVQVFQQPIPQNPPSSSNRYVPPSSARRQNVPSGPAGHSVQQNIVKPRPPGRHPMCGVLPSSGDCRAAFPRYYYNNKTDQCDCFLFGGCGDSGLKYSYQTLRECQATCLPSKREEGPACKEIFREEEFFFDPLPPPPPRPAASHQQQPQQYAPRPNTNHISDEALVSLLMNGDPHDDMYEDDDDDNRGVVDRNYF